MPQMAPLNWLILFFFFFLMFLLINMINYYMYVPLIKKTNFFTQNKQLSNWML